MIPIILAADENYFIPLLVTLKSILINTKEKVYVKILTDHSYPEEKVSQLIALSNSYGSKIEFQDMSSVNKLLKTTIPHITVATYYRLWATDVFKDFDKCIYLDVDIIVKGDISLLYEINIDDYYVAGVKAPQFHLKKDGYSSHCARLGIKDICQYINAGVTLLNLKKIREDNLDDVFQNLISKQYPVQDQDIINAACYDNIKLLHPKFNLMITQDVDERDMSTVFGEKDATEALENPVVIHYAGRIKPWKTPIIKFSYEWWNVAMSLELPTLIWNNMQRSLEAEISGYKQSTEYKIGSIFTYLPRKIKITFSALKYVGFKGLIYKLKVIK